MMGISFLSIAIGSLISLFAGLSMLLNMFVTIVVYNDGFLNPSQSSIYIFAFVNVAGNAFQMALSAFYLGPSSIAQDFLFIGGKDSFGTTFVSYLFLAQWYQDMFLQAVIAIDRLVTVVFFRYADAVSRKIKIIIATMLFPCGLLLSFFADYFISCCTVYIYYGSYSYAYLDTGYNNVNHYIDIPLNCTSSGIALISYATIYVYILHQNRKIHQISTQISNARRAKEVRYAIQFVALSGFGTFAWISFRVFPLFIPVDKMELFCLIEFTLILHCSANSLIFITINKEFRHKFRNHIVRIKSIIGSQRA